MGRVLQEFINDFAGGVVSSNEPDTLPGNTLPRAYNCELTSEGQGRAIIAKRNGCATMNDTPITDSSAVLGQFEFFNIRSGVMYHYHLLVSQGATNQRVDYMSTGGTTTAIATTGLGASGQYFPSFAQANNMVFIANGNATGKVRYSGSALELTSFGIADPSSAPTITASGTTGNHNGTYEARVTYYDTVSGHESSCGPTSATCAPANKTILWTNIPVSAAGYARKLYLRNVSTMVNFYWVATLDGDDTTYESNLLDSSLTAVGPDEYENDPPSSSVKYLAWHKGRMFAATDSALYYSKAGDPESFDPDFWVLIDKDSATGKVMGLHSAHDVLIIFKEHAVYALNGDDPANWTVQLIIPDLGCVSFRSIVTVEGLTYWWSEEGPLQWDGSGMPKPIGVMALEPDVRAINSAQYPIICAAPDIQNQRILWGVPEASQSRNTIMLPFNYRLQKWESLNWKVIDPSSLAPVEDANGLPWVMIGGYAGQVFKLGSGTNDGVPSGSTSATFTATTTSYSSITGTGFYNSGGKLIERYVTLVDAYGQYVAQRRITTNDSTTLTLVSAITGLTIGASYTAIIGGPRFEFDTRWSDMSDRFYNGSFRKKRFEFLNLETKSVSGTIPIYVALAFNRDEYWGQAKDISTTRASANWNASMWDSASYGYKQVVQNRLRVGRTGVTWRGRIWNYQPDQAVIVRQINMRAEDLSAKIG